MNIYRKLFSELWRYKTYFLVSLIAGVIMSLANSQLAILAKPLFDALENKDTETIIRTPLLLLLFAFIMGVSRYFHLFYNHYMIDCVTVGLRKRLQKKFMNLSSGFHNQYSSGSGGLLSRALNDVHIVETGMGMFADFIREPVLFFILMGWLFYVDWQLTLVLITALPFVLLFIRSISKSLQKYSHISQQDMEGLTGSLKEGLDGVRVIQSFNLESEMAKRFDFISKKYLEARKKIHSRSEMAPPITEFIATTLVLGIFVYMGLRISQDQSSLGDFAGYLAGLLLIQKPVKKLQESFVKFQRTIVCAERIYAILESEDEVREIENPKPFPKDWSTIEYRNVGFSYLDKPALKNFNIKINRGDVVALVGESGSGKSTVVNLLERFFDPTEGDILVDGVSLNDFKLSDLRKNIALVTQDVFLFNDSIEYNINAGDFSRKPSEVESSAKSANAHNFIVEKETGYKTRVGDRGGLLSGGERQRVSIARAFIKDAPILILDEATSALDSASELEVQKGIDILMKGRTVLVIAHRLSTVLKADKIIVMKDGEIVEMGNHHALIEKKGEYFKFKNLQST